MKARTVAAVLALVILAGCAHGGGSGGGSSSANNSPPPAACFFLFFLCIFAAFDDSVSGPNATTGSTEAEATFTNWAELKREVRTGASGVGIRTGYETNADGTIRYVGTSAAGDAVVKYDASGKLISFGDGVISYGPSGATLATMGQPGIDRLDGSAGSTALVANPYALGWNYQSFGAWNQQHSAGNGTISVSSFGQATPASAVPTSGQAKFTGKSAGFYVSPTGQGSIASADVTVNANFSARSLGFSTSGTTIARDPKAPTAAPQLNLNGTFTYSPAANAFTGTLTNAAGTMSGSSRGQFYGPTAQELGGAFSVKSSTTSEMLTGAYGAKR